MASTIAAAILERAVKQIIDYSPKIILSLIILVVGYILIRVFKKILSKVLQKVNLDESIEQFFASVLGAALWVILIIVILANLGVNVTGLVAGLGVAGLIVGFALQDALSNLASGVFILFHKPFKIGDWINIGGIVGGVERIGMAACRLSAPDGTKIIIPNKKVWSDTIQNYTGNPVRKLFNLEVGISYSDDIGKAIKIIQDILKKDKRVLKDPAPQVVAKGFGDSSITIAARPAVKKEDYWTVYFDTVKAIKEEFDKKGITIPFPQRDVWLKGK
jgi:small conductance mechanosensitive channel